MTRTPSVVCRLELLVAGALAALVLTACAGDNTAPSTVTRADSAGVKLITSSQADTALAWKLDSVDVLRDSLGEPWIFNAATPQRVLTDRAGRTYVLEGEPAIRRFARDGRYERSFGRKGGAPGEMEFPIALMQQGDSIAVYDIARRVLVRWGPDLDPINDVRITGALENVNTMAFRVGGQWIERYEFDSTGTRHALFGDTLSTEPLLRLVEPRPKKLNMGCGSGTSMTLFRAPLFSPELHWHTAGPRMLASVGPAYDVGLYEGPRLIARVRRSVELPKPTVDDVKRLHPEGMKAMVVGGASCEASAESMIEQVGIADVMPAIHGLALLSDGTMWVQRSLREETPVLDVFGSDGAYAGTLRGYHLPVGRLPNGEVLFPVSDEESGGLTIRRVLIRK